MSSTPPFAAGSISLRLYPHNERDAGGIIRELCDQAKLGLAGGFDGIMASEHHGGFAGYLPNPLQLSSFILEENQTGWVAPCPVILPLRPVAQLAEEIAWLDARRPGRVGLGVAAGALPLDFEAMGVPFGEAVPRFKAGLPRIVDMLQGRDLGVLEADRALRGCASSPVPVLSAAASTAAARRAAGCGAGLLTEGMSSVKRLRSFCDAYDEAGGIGSKVIIRRVWVGEPNAQLVAEQRAVYESYARDNRLAAGDETIVATDPAELAERIYAGCVEAGGDAINLRVHLPGITAAEVRQQITVLTESVLPGLRKLMAERRGAAGDPHPG
ncbi:MAG TPA: LLM class flavin-dependent oxidoreductase [Acidimicrobiales bacterium]|jgi:alkanesulfonate monooxygenase SsuD/methylene tetrahydromethanopterin reductase-like flavin-dependent oxidoreductase (luciferase family)|nr:LLM class flavin-dependent oxidoreductase [Acidimicrobiales bacterium]